MYEPDACIIHVHTETWAQVRRRYHREGMAARWVGIRILRHIPGEVVARGRDGARRLWLARVTSDDCAALRRDPEIPVREDSSEPSAASSTAAASPIRRAAPRCFFKRSFPAVVVRGPASCADRGTHCPQPEARRGPRPRIVRRHLWRPISRFSRARSGVLQVWHGRLPDRPGPRVIWNRRCARPPRTGLSEGDRVVVECIQGCGECVECARDEAIRCRDRREVGCDRPGGAYAGYLVTRATVRAPGTGKR